MDTYSANNECLLNKAIKKKEEIQRSFQSILWFFLLLLMERWCHQGFPRGWTNAIFVVRNVQNDWGYYFRCKKKQYWQLRYCNLHVQLIFALRATPRTFFFHFFKQRRKNSNCWFWVVIFMFFLCCFHKIIVFFCNSGA